MTISDFVSHLEECLVEAEIDPEFSVESNETFDFLPDNAIVVSGEGSDQVFILRIDKVKPNDYKEAIKKAFSGNLR